MTYTVPATVSTGGTSTSAQFNAALGVDLKAFASKAQMHHETGFALLASTTAKLVGMTADYDSPDTMLDLVNQRIVFKQAGGYRVRAGAAFGGGAPWTLFVRKNGAGTWASVNGVAAGLNIDLLWEGSMVVNDYIELWYTNPNAILYPLYEPIPYAPDEVDYYLSAEWIAP